MTKPLPFTELSVRRAIAAARKEGVKVGAVKVDPNGAVTVFDESIAPAIAPTQDASPSPWEDIEA
jgi:uncharacterized protein GlcG (DUF336 family)